MIAVLCALCLTSGSSRDGGPEAALAQYLARLGRALATRAPVPDPISVPAPPRPGELRLPLPGNSLDTLDFFSLSGCAVQATIGKRSSSLGRTAADSQRLLLELEYLRLAPECIALQRSKGRTGLARTLETAWQAGRAQLPALIFNATLAGAEYRQFWRARIAPGDYPRATGSGAIEALEAIDALARRWLSGDYRADNLEFEIYLGEVATGEGGALLEALARQGAWLSAAEATLEARRRHGPLCTRRGRYTAAASLPHAVRQFFIGRVQPHSTALDRRYHRLLPPVRELEDLLAATLPPVFLDWQARRDQLLEQLANAPRHHAERLQSLAAPCGAIAAPG